MVYFLQESSDCIARKEYPALNLFADTCVLPRCRLETAALYREEFGPELGFELLPMFDLQGWEENLKANLPFFEQGLLSFHEPVWGVEHSAPPGSAGWEESMYHLRLTKKYADILHPRYMVYHLTNCVIPPAGREELLRVSLENRERMQDYFPGIPLLTENTGIRADGTLLLDQEEFTALCLNRKMDALIDVGHANANGWDLFRLIRDLKDRIRAFHLHNNDGIHDQHNRLADGTLDFRALISFIARNVPDADLIVEYTRPEYHGVPLCEDLRYLHDLLLLPGT